MMKCKHVVCHQCESESHLQTKNELSLALAQVSDLERRLKRYADTLESLADLMRRPVREAEEPKVGMRVPDHSDFISAARLPSLVSSFKWWVRYIEDVLNDTKG